VLTRITSSDTQNDLTNVDTGNCSIGLSPGTTHTSLQSIGTSAGQHLVDTDDVVRVGTDAKMETFLSTDLDKVSVYKNQYTGQIEMLLVINAEDGVSSTIFHPLSKECSCSTTPP
jgi:hypothetical protein